MGQPRLPYDDSIDGIDDLESFSFAIENWHNIVHMQFPLPNLADPQRNIYLRDFWALHLLLDERFDQCLQRDGIDFADMDPQLHPTV